MDWTPGEGAEVSEQALQDHATRLIADPETGAILDTGGGDVDAASAKAASNLEATYTTASVLHFQLEPMNALAFEKDGIFEIHTGNQWQSLILPTLAKALGVPKPNHFRRQWRSPSRWARSVWKVGPAAVGLAERLRDGENIDRRARYFSRQVYQSLHAVVGYGHCGQHTGVSPSGLAPPSQPS